MTIRVAVQITASGVTAAATMEHLIGFETPPVCRCAAWPLRCRDRQLVEQASYNLKKISIERCATAKLSRVVAKLLHG
jgi:hypothetical protein